MKRRKVAWDICKLFIPMEPNDYTEYCLRKVERLLTLYKVGKTRKQINAENRKASDWALQHVG